MKLVVGLGNPGAEYASTRHNVGFILLDNYLKNEHWQVKFNGEYIMSSINDEKFIFLKPQSYMNLSGGVVKKFANYFDIDCHDIIVIQDDLDLPMGKLKIKVDSSSGGHNGIKDIINNLNTKEFIRIKIGISNDKLIDTKDYVLGKMTKNEKELILNNLDIVKDIIENCNYENIDKYMSKYN